MAGEYTEILSNKLNWTTEFREKFQQEKRYGVQQGHCFNSKKIKLANDGLVSYPKNMKEYVRNNECNGEGEGSGAIKLGPLFSFMIVVCLTFLH